ncbi:transcription initiation factor TFIID subunit 6-like isoform X1 [Anopheles moucheti]|uniref:transcription initiation factor TFIID subunit 6-like isoform X1 n=1 Tax=Anopheles moucheti TaxID=186751 RepID=UPI0022F0DF01|nr:transcription initiation factor TFIID subunit 6-like isoform X1 [Anopheles moucheti]
MGDRDKTMYGSTLSLESMKVIAESIGVGSLPDDAAKELADDVSFKLKQIVQDAVKFMHHSKRMKLSIADIDHSLKVRNIEPQYGFVARDFIPFRFASGGGRELHFIEEKEVDLTEVVQGQSPKIPLEASLRAHWLAVEGVQPTVPENPPPLSKDVQALDSVNPAHKLDKTNLKDTTGKPTINKHKLKNSETVQVKQLAQHELSVEQQLYYKEITEACVGSDEARRAEALTSLSSDPGLHEMLPRMCTFIAEGVKVNVVQNNLALLIYLMRMVRALLDNPALYLEKYLHELIPCVSTCIVSRQLCMRPELDNHWALRDFAARLMAQICKTFNTSTNNLQTRVTRLFSAALQNDKTPLSSMYGALQGLSELGTEVTKVFIIPRLKFISERVEPLLQGITSNISNTDKIAAGHIRTMLLKGVPPILKTLRNPPDLVEDYKRDYGCLGQTLHQAVVKARSASPSSGAAGSGGPSGASSAPSVTTSITVSTSSNSSNTIVLSAAAPSRPQTPQSSTIAKTMAATASIQRPATATGGSGLTQVQSQQKFVIVPQRTQTPSPSQDDFVGPIIQRQSSVSSGTPIATTGTAVQLQPSMIKLESGALAGMGPNVPAASGTPIGQKVVIINQSQTGPAANIIAKPTAYIPTGGTGGNLQEVQDDIIQVPPELDDLSHLE